MRAPRHIEQGLVGGYSKGDDAFGDEIQEHFRHHVDGDALK
jgi:hypothetical protein